MKKYFLFQVKCLSFYTDSKETRTIYRQFMELAIYEFLGKSVSYKMG